MVKAASLCAVSVLRRRGLMPVLTSSFAIGHLHTDHKGCTNGRRSQVRPPARLANQGGSRITFVPFPAAPFGWVVLAAAASAAAGTALLLVPGLLARLRSSPLLAVTAIARTARDNSSDAARRLRGGGLLAVRDFFPTARFAVRHQRRSRRSVLLSPQDDR